MGLEKAIKSGKEHRKEYRGAKACDATCRNHGSCLRCEGNRKIQRTKEELKIQSKLDDWEGENKERER